MLHLKQRYWPVLNGAYFTFCLDFPEFFVGNLIFSKHFTKNKRKIYKKPELYLAKVMKNKKKSKIN